MAIEPVNLGPVFRVSIYSGHEPYRDRIHPNALGQKLIADELYGPIAEKLNLQGAD
jgi:lysophospholipase L1-like esterase